MENEIARRMRLTEMITTKICQTEANRHNSLQSSLQSSFQALLLDLLRPSSNIFGDF